MGTKNFTEKYYKDRDGWLKISARDKKFRMTAEQVLNHLLPAMAGIKPGLILKVEHQELPRKKQQLKGELPVAGPDSTGAIKTYLQ